MGTSEVATSATVLCRDGQVRAFPGRFVFLDDVRRRAVGAMGVFAARAGDEEAFGPVRELATGAHPQG